MTIKHFSHADKTREYIMAYLLSLPSSVEKSTRAITEVVEENMRRDGLKPARSIGYLMRELERLGKVSKRGQQFWKAVRTPIEDGYSREQLQLAIKLARDIISDSIDQAMKAMTELNLALARMDEWQPPETSQADDSGDRPTDIKADE